MTTKTAPISGEALRTWREEKRLSQRELGRRVAARLGREKGTRALQVRLSRIETGDKISEEDRELVDALAAELALGDGQLAVPPRWIWFSTALGGPTFVSFALRMLLFSSPEKAYDAKDFLSIQIGPKAMEDARLIPIRQESIKEVLEHNFGPLDDEEREALVAVDPDPSQLRWLAANQVALNGEFLTPGGDYAAEEDPREEAARLALEHREFETELVELHSLALRRLQHAPPAPHLYDSWRREEQILMGILDRVHELRHQQRDEALRSKT